MGLERVFLDTSDIRSGNDYETLIHRELAGCDLFIPVIGLKWEELLRLKRDSGENDIMAREIRAAITFEKPIVPLLVDGAAMPASTALPAAIRELHFKNAISASSTDPPERLRELFRPPLNTLSASYKLGTGWTATYITASLLAYFFCAVLPHLVGWSEYGGASWRGMATTWSGFFIWPIFFLPFALVALNRPIRLLVEAILNAERLRQAGTYALPFLVGIVISALAMAIEINTEHQVPWTVHPVFDPARGAPHCNSPRPGTSYTAQQLVGVVTYDTDRRLEQSLMAEGGRVPFWLRNKCWPGAFHYLTSRAVASNPVYLAERQQIQRRFVALLLSEDMDVNRVRLSDTFVAYVISFGILILLGALGVAMAVFFVTVQIRRASDDEVLKLPSEDGYLCLTYAFVSLMLWVPFRMITVYNKSLYYCSDLGAGCGLEVSHYLNDLVIGAVFLLGFVYLTAGLLFRYRRLLLAGLGAIAFLTISGLAVIVIGYAEHIAPLADMWQFYVGIAIPAIFILMALWFQFDPAVVRFNDFKREVGAK